MADIKKVQQARALLRNEPALNECCTWIDFAQARVGGTQPACGVLPAVTVDVNVQGRFTSVCGLIGPSPHGPFQSPGPTLQDADGRYIPGVILGDYWPFKCRERWPEIPPV